MNIQDLYKQVGEKIEHISDKAVMSYIALGNMLENKLAAALQDVSSDSLDADVTKAIANLDTTQIQEAVKYYDGNTPWEAIVMSTSVATMAAGFLLMAKGGYDNVMYHEKNEKNIDIKELEKNGMKFISGLIIGILGIYATAFSYIGFYE